MQIGAGACVPLYAWQPWPRSGSRPAFGRGPGVRVGWRAGWEGRVAGRVEGGGVAVRVWRWGGVPGGEGMGREGGAGRVGWLEEMG